MKFLSWKEVELWWQIMCWWPEKSAKFWNCIVLYTWIFQISKFVCLFLGFSREFRHKFYTQNEDPGMSYCIKLGLKQRTKTPEIRKIRNLSTTKNTLTFLTSQETNISQETALPKDETPSQICMLGSSNLFMGRFAYFEASCLGGEKLRPKWSCLEVLLSNVEDFLFRMVVSKDSIVSHKGFPWDPCIYLHWMVDFYGKCKYTTYTYTYTAHGSYGF